MTPSINGVALNVQLLLLSNFICIHLFYESQNVPLLLDHQASSFLSVSCKKKSQVWCNVCVQTPILHPTNKPCIISWKSDTWNSKFITWNQWWLKLQYLHGTKEKSPFQTVPNYCGYSLQSRCSVIVGKWSEAKSGLRRNKCLTVMPPNSKSAHFQPVTKPINQYRCGI